MKWKRRTGTRCLCALGALVMMVMSVGSAVAGPQDYWWTRTYDWTRSGLAKIDKNTGQGTVVGYDTYLGGGGLAFTKDNTLWGTFTSIHGDNHFGIGILDQSTGDITEVGSGFSTFISSLETDDAGHMYGEDGDNFYSINTTNGVASLLGSGIGGIDDLAFDSTTGTMWGMSTTTLFTIDLSNGQKTTAGNMPWWLGVTSGLAFDENGTMYLTLSGSNPSMYIIDKNNVSGNPTLVGDGTVDLFYPGNGDFGPSSVPLPPSALLAIVGFGFVLIVRRRYFR